MSVCMYYVPEGYIFSLGEKLTLGGEDLEYERGECSDGLFPRFVSDRVMETVSSSSFSFGFVGIVILSLGVSSLRIDISFRCCLLSRSIDGLLPLT